ncbi:hypothetical protein J1N35_023067 [Gossypium stocksii]|uniref:Uncharacterized protein n=1 Tax=Gossypium stocksii TaxID=47602 RepID=A0A9D3VI43_9ROSI|nr:hypothetical protein J1N35_023067 [Gossypium stocksii]
MAKSLKEQAFATPEAMAELVQRYIQLFSKNFCCDSKEETLFTEPINKNNSFQTYQVSCFSQIQNELYSCVSKTYVSMKFLCPTLMFEAYQDMDGDVILQ